MTETDQLIKRCLWEYDGPGSLTGIQVTFYLPAPGEQGKEDWNVYLQFPDQGPDGQRTLLGGKVVCSRSSKDRANLEEFVRGIIEEIQEYAERVAPWAKKGRYTGDLQEQPKSRVDGLLGAMMRMQQNALASDKKASLDYEPWDGVENTEDWRERELIKLRLRSEQRRLGRGGTA